MKRSAQEAAALPGTQVKGCELGKDLSQVISNLLGRAPSPGLDVPNWSEACCKPWYAG